MGSLLKKLPLSTKEKLKQISSGIFRPLFCYVASKQGERNAILLVDSLGEKDAPHLDSFPMFEYMMSLEDCEFEPYYLMRDDGSEWTRCMRRKYGKRIIFFKSRLSPILIVRLTALLKKVRFVCEAFLGLRWMSLSLDVAVKDSPYIDTIFTQHGITFFKDTFIRKNTYGIKNYDKVMVSNPIEEQIFIDRGGFESSDIIRNGLFRWDSMIPITSEEKSIFVYFTYRSYLKRMNRPEDSIYFKTIMDLLNDKELIDLISNNGIRLKVGMHHSLADVCKNALSTKVDIVSQDEIADIKRSSNLLITDYSAMCFEFYHQNKPVIFYQIDDEGDCTRYGESVDEPKPFEGKEQYFENIIANKDEFINLLRSYIENGFDMTEEEEKKAGDVFFYRDCYCQRFYKKLCELK